MSGHLPFSELTKDFTPERRQRIEAKKTELRATMEEKEIPAFGDYMGAIGKRLKIRAEFLEGWGRYRLWAVPAMALILAVVMVPRLPDGLFGRIPEEPTTVSAKVVDVQREQAMVQTEIQNSVRLLIGTEERLKQDGFLETGRGFSRFSRTAYKLVKRPAGDDPQVRIVPIGNSLALKPNQRLKQLVVRSRTLEKGRDYIVEQNGNVTSVVFTNEILRGSAVLAVIENEESH